MENRTEGQKQLEAFINRLAGESAIDHSLENRFTRFDRLEVDTRAKMLKSLAESFKMDPSLVDDFDLQGIEVPDLMGFLMEAWEKSGAAKPIFGGERRFG